MKLTGKILLIYGFAVALLTALYGYSVSRREDQRLKHEMEQQAQSIGLAMERELLVTWQERGHTGVSQIIGRADDKHQEMSIRWIALNAKQFVPDRSAPIEELKLADRGRVLTVVSRDRQRVYYPIDVANERAGCLEFSQPLTGVDQYTRDTIYQTSALILGMVACGGIVAFLGIRLVGQPLEKLIERTRQIGQGNFLPPLQLRGNDELNQLATALNDMSQQLSDQQEKIRAESAARLATVEQLRHVDRLKTVGRLASGVAHELGTPLNVVSGRAELIASGHLNEEQGRESALAIKSEADRMANIIRQLLDFGRRGTPERKSVDLRQVADQCVALLRSLATKHHVELVVSGDESLRASANAAQIQQVVTNLVVNAIQAMPGGGTASIDVRSKRAQPPNATDANEETYCCLAVTDEGAGISDDNLQHLFEPFFTTKDVGEGTGLGLSVSYGIVQDHDGWIDVKSEPGKGSCFSVFLPEDCLSQ